MFGFLKDKIKNAVSKFTKKVEEEGVDEEIEVEVEVPKEEKKSKDNKKSEEKENKKESKKEKKEAKKEKKEDKKPESKKDKEEKKSRDNKKSEETESEDIEEQPKEEKKGFLGKLKSVFSRKKDEDLDDEIEKVEELKDEPQPTEEEIKEIDAEADKELESEPKDIKEEIEKETEEIEEDIEESEEKEKSEEIKEGSDDEIEKVEELKDELQPTEEEVKEIDEEAEKELESEPEEIKEEIEKEAEEIEEKIEETEDEKEFEESVEKLEEEVKEEDEKVENLKENIEKDDKDILTAEKDSDDDIEKTISEAKEEVEVEIEEEKEKKKKEEHYDAPVEEEKKGFFAKLKQKISTKRISEQKFDDMFWELELALLENGVAVEVIDKIKSDLKEKVVDKPIPKKEVEKVIINTLMQSIKDILDQPTFDLIEKIKEKRKKEKKPFVICFVGVNGAGKTTTIAKLVNLFKTKKMTSVIAAADTFRAAAIDQLQVHADKLETKLIKHDYDADPAAVAFDAIKHAESKNVDVVLIDTAGRLHSNSNLMDELHKIIRVSKPDLTIFLGESITGNDCIEQAREFDKMVDIDGIILSKADIDEKGGAAISISYVLGKPILYLGVGQEYKDLKKFTADYIIEQLSK